MEGCIFYRPLFALALYWCPVVRRYKPGKIVNPGLCPETRHIPSLIPESVPFVHMCSHCHLVNTLSLREMYSRIIDKSIVGY